MLPEKFKRYQYILASKSPRRQYLLKELGFQFRVEVRETRETFPDGLKAPEIVMYLSTQKADAFPAGDLQENELLITADTIVWFENQVLGKPADAEEAVNILSRLNGRMHEVFTGVSLKTREKAVQFYDRSAVWFKSLTTAEIAHYVNHYQPFDKAGAYGVQEWIGYVGVEKIEGSFFNVMGFPTHKFYEYLEQFIENE